MFTLCLTQNLKKKDYKKYLKQKEKPQDTQKRKKEGRNDAAAVGVESNLLHIDVHVWQKNCHSYTLCIFSRHATDRKGG